MHTVLLIADAREFGSWLEEGGAPELENESIATAPDVGKARRRLRRGTFECVCCDLEAIGLEEGLALQEWARRRNPHCEWLWIVPSGWPEEQLERLDGWPYAIKPLRPGRLSALLSRTLKRIRDRRELTITGQASPVLPQKRPVSLSASDMVVLQQIFSYVDEHLPTELKREVIADLVHFHPVYLSRFFKSRTGTSLSQYIVNRRIEKAKSLLSHSELQVSHIVHRLGYYNSSHFTRAFKQATGYTPRQYRSAAYVEPKDDERPRTGY